MRLVQAFEQVYGRRPSMLDLRDPYFLAQIRRSCSDVQISDEQKDASEALRYFPHISASDKHKKTWFGAKQAWFGRKAQRVAGCGPASVANTLACLAAKDADMAAKLGLVFEEDGRISQRVFVQFMEQVYRTVGTFEVPIWRKAAEKVPKESGLPPASFGQMGAGVDSGLLRFAAKRGVVLQPRRLQTSYADYEKALDFIRAGLAAGCPVTLLTVWNKHPLKLYYGGYTHPPTARKQGMSRHFVSIVGVRQRIPGRPELIISSWGEICSIDFKQLHQSWQSPRAAGSGMWWYQPGGSVQQMKRQSLVAYAAPLGSIGKTAVGIVKDGIRFGKRH